MPSFVVLSTMTEESYDAGFLKNTPLKNITLQLFELNYKRIVISVLLPKRLKHHKLITCESLLIVIVDNLLKFNL